MKEAENYNRYLTGLVAAQIRRGDRVADFGAGTGTFALPLLASGVNVLCVEPDPLLADRLGQVGAHVLPHLDDVPDGVIDLLYTLNVLEHIVDDDSAVAGFYRVLRPGGRLFVYVPAFQLIYSAMDRKVGHVRRYRRAGLVGLLERWSFRVDRARYCDCLGFAAALVYRAVGSGGGDIDRTALRLYDRAVFPLSRRLDHLAGRWIGKNLAVSAHKA